MMPIIYFLLAIVMMSACGPSKATLSPESSQTSSPTVTSTLTSLPISTPLASQNSNPTSSPTSIPTQSASEEYCEQLLASYHPANGYQTYCDTKYGFAFDYPESWTNVVAARWPDNSLYVPATTARKMMIFHTDGDMSNFMYIRTYYLYDNTTFHQRVENSLGYDDRSFPDKSYPTLVLGGHRAYAVMECSPQAYNSVHLYFQQGQYYTDMELKEVDRSGLDTNWQIARTIQTPGYPPDKNVIPQELVDDSYQLLACFGPPYPIFQVTP